MELSCPFPGCTCPLKTMLGLLKHVVSWHVEAPEDHDQAMLDWLRQNPSEAQETVESERNPEEQDEHATDDHEDQREQEDDIEDEEQEHEEEVSEDASENLAEQEEEASEDQEPVEIKKEVVAEQEEEASEDQEPVEIKKEVVAEQEEEASEDQEPVEIKKEVADPSSALQCRICDKDFKSRTRLVRHEGEVHVVAANQDVLACLNCQQEFSEPDSFVAHVEEFHSDEYKCELCSRGFTHSTRLRDHIRISHNIRQGVRSKPSSRKRRRGNALKPVEKKAKIEDDIEEDLDVPEEGDIQAVQDLLDTEDQDRNQEDLDESVEEVSEEEEVLDDDDETDGPDTLYDPEDDDEEESLEEDDEEMAKEIECLGDDDDAQDDQGGLNDEDGEGDQAEEELCGDQKPIEVKQEYIDPVSALQCRICHKDFQSRARLVRHEGEVHVVAALRNVLACLHCRQEFSKAESLVGHVADAHSNEFKCEVCSRGFNHSTRLRDHQRIKHKIKKEVA